MTVRAGARHTRPGILPVVILLVTLLAGVVSPVRAQEPRLAARLPEPLALRITRLADSARALGLPSEPLIQKALEGESKGADGFRIERGYAPAVAADLAARGHPVVEADIPLGGAQAILIHQGGTLEGGSDPRKDGCALGY